MHKLLNSKAGIVIHHPEVFINDDDNKDDKSGGIDYIFTVLPLNPLKSITS
jgi:hypothetical protein